MLFVCSQKNLTQTFSECFLRKATLALCSPMKMPISNIEKRYFLLDLIYLNPLFLILNPFFLSINNVTVMSLKDSLKDIGLLIKAGKYDEAEQKVIVSFEAYVNFPCRL